MSYSCLIPLMEFYIFPYFDTNKDQIDEVKEIMQSKS